jgi:hypothetical protein
LPQSLQPGLPGTAFFPEAQDEELERKSRLFSKPVFGERITRHDLYAMHNFSRKVHDDAICLGRLSPMQSHH